MIKPCNGFNLNRNAMGNNKNKRKAMLKETKAATITATGI